MKVVKRCMAFLMAALLCMVISPKNAYAASDTKEGVKVTVTADKSSYYKNDTINLTIDVENQNTYSVKNLKISLLLPDGVKLSTETNYPIVIAELAPGFKSTVVAKAVYDPAVVSYATPMPTTYIENTIPVVIVEPTVTPLVTEVPVETDEPSDEPTIAVDEPEEEDIEEPEPEESEPVEETVIMPGEETDVDQGEEDIPKTGDSIQRTVLLVIGLLALCIVGLYLTIRYRKKLNVFLSLLLVAALISNLFMIHPQKANAAEIKEFIVNEEIVLNGVKTAIGVKISYESEPVVIPSQITLQSSMTEISEDATGTVIYFYADVTGKAGTVSLCNAVNNEIICEMRDDGQYSVSGDDLPNDGRYSAKLTYTEITQGQLTYYANLIVDEKEYRSNPCVIKVNQTMTDEAIEKMMETDDQISTLMTSEAYLAADHDQKVQMLLDLLTALSKPEAESGKEAAIAEGSIVYDKETDSISYEYACGIPGFILLESFNPDLLGASGEEAVTQEEIIDENAVDTEQPEGAEELKSNDAVEGSAALEDSDELKSSDADPEESDVNIEDALTARREQAQNPSFLMKAVEAAPEEEVLKFADACIVYNIDGMDGDSLYPYYTELKEAWDSKGLETDIIRGATVEKYKTVLNNKDIVVIATHGRRLNFAYSQEEARTRTVVYTGQAKTVESFKQYYDDVINKRVLTAMSSGIVRYYLTSQFFDYYYGTSKMLDSIAFLGICSGFGEGLASDIELPQSLLTGGAATVYGYRNTTYALYSSDWIGSVVEQLLEGDTTKQAFEDACDAVGHNDEEWRINHHYPGIENKEANIPTLLGRETKTLISTGLKNGNFEADNKPLYWETTGDVRILTKLAELNPVDGTKMAILTTGIGSAESSYKSGTEGSVLSQTFIVPENASTIKFTYDVISEEPMEFVGSEFDDGFDAKLESPSGDLLTMLASESINQSVWQPISDIDFEAGDSTTYHTGWKEVSYDISQLRGQRVTLEFHVWDKSDSIYDTATIVDAIQLTAAN